MLIPSVANLSHSWMHPCQILYKLDKHGQGEEIRLEDLPMNTGISFTGFSHEMFSQVTMNATQEEHFEPRVLSQ